VLIGREIPDGGYIRKAIAGILKGISDPELQCIFRNWIERVERVINA
jgi:hypothetical protein